jgi:Lon-like protease
VRPTSETSPRPFGRRERRWPRALTAIVALVMVGAAFTVPLPLFYIYLPGPVRDVERLVRVQEAPTYASEGSLLMTTVSVDVNATAADMVAAAFDPFKAVITRDQLLGNQGSLQRVEEQQRQAMDQSKRDAETVALTALGLDEPTGEGARVTHTVARSPADGVLRPGDVIVAIDGTAVATTCDVGETLDRTEIGDEVEIVVRRDGATASVRVETVPHPGDPRAAFIGVAMEDVGYRFEPGVEVDFETGRVAGPSAGLMFTLALYDRLTPEDLTGGRAIAGTGTIDCGGGVGPIGGIVQKVAAAESRGADVFLAPTRDAAEARSVADGIEVVAVSDFGDALAYLEGGSS